MRKKGQTFKKVLSSERLIFLVILGLILISGTAKAAPPEEPLTAPTTDELLVLPPIEIDGRQTVTLDSGLVSLEVPFPPDIMVKVDLGKKCYDLWMTIDAKPQK